MSAIFGLYGHRELALNQEVIHLSRLLADRSAFCLSRVRLIVSQCGTSARLSLAVAAPVNNSGVTNHLDPNWPRSRIDAHTRLAIHYQPHPLDAYSPPYRQSVASGGN